MARGLVRRESVETEMHKSGDKGTTFVFTKKRGYDVTRTPHLNKVGARGAVVSIFNVCFSEQRVHTVRSGTVGNNKNSKPFV